MMSLNPSQHIDGLIKIHPNLVIFHAEANDDLLPLFDRLKQNGIKTGVAIIKNVYPGNIKPLLNAADYALIFSGTLGQYGGEADLLLLEKVALIREIHKNIEIGWDGGANLDNTHIITHAGVDVINVGSAISRAPDPAMAFTNLNNATEKESAL
jgi:ribulose-phosphate 3-epimerase